MRFRERRSRPRALRRVVSVTFTALALSLAFTGSAYAKKPQPADAEQAKVASSQEEAPVVKSIDPSTVRVGGGTLATEGILASGCRELTWRRTAYNFWGATLFSYVRWVRWCWSGSYITYVASRAWGEVSWPGWAFKGTINSWSAGGTWRTYYRVWSQGHFCWVEYFACVMNSYPWIDVTVYPGGGWYRTSGG